MTASAMPGSQVRQAAVWASTLQFFRISATYLVTSLGSEISLAAEVHAGAAAHSAAPICAKTSLSNLKKPSLAPKRKSRCGGMKLAKTAAARVRRLVKRQSPAAPVRAARRCVVNRDHTPSPGPVQPAREPAVG